MVSSQQPVGRRSLQYGRLQPDALVIPPVLVVDVSQKPELVRLALQQRSREIDRQ